MAAAYVLTLGAVALALPWARQRWLLSRAKHRSLAGHSRLAKRVASLLPGYAYGEERFFSADGAPADVVARRRAALQALEEDFNRRFARGIALTEQARPGIADLQFISAYRVPFQFSPLVRQHLRLSAFVQAAHGVEVEDLDGNRFIDLTGSYGVNVFGADFYKVCMADGLQAAQALGPVLGSYHPCVADNVARLRAISGMEEVSFHMSGTEAVMQAVRLARYHTGRKHVVRFCGAYHGWWEDVQPGPGNPMPPRETYTLRDMDPRSLRVLRSRRDIACVLVNPLQALHPNRNAPGDGQLVDGSRRSGADREAYAAWLRELRAVCTERGIPLIFDEVFVGFRLAPGGAQDYFGVRADMVTYGKTLGGGLPVGVVCGPHALMRRYRPERPANVCFARGTFNAHPMVMTSMNAFLRRLDDTDIRACYEGLDERWDLRAKRFNEAMNQAGVPLRASHLSSIWTLDYTQPGRYHWMLQYYLRRHGIALSWVGTGRLIFGLQMGDADFERVVERFVAAAQDMRDGGWWWHDGQMSDRAIRRSVLRELLAQRWR